VVARVNHSEITILQLKAAMAQSPTVSAETAKMAAGPVLEHLIDEELVVQKAEEMKLDRNPQVAQAMEAAKRAVLASAYLQRYAADTPAPTDREIHDYYSQHPEYFGARRVYTYRAIPALAPPADLTAIEQQVAAASSLDAVTALLREKKINFVIDSASKSTEELPAAVSTRLAALKEGDLATFPVSGGVEILQLLASRAEPVSEDQARPFIEKYLLEQRRRERAEGEIKALRSAASIQYTGEVKAPVVKSAPPKAAAGDVTTSIAKGLQ
jgi:EpsD family peptidyl-prolyl cis-trans isomerase